MGPKPHYYGGNARDHGVEVLVSSNPDVWQALRDEMSWNGWIWRWSKEQAEDEAKARQAETGAAHRAFKHAGTP